MEYHYVLHYNRLPHGKRLWQTIFVVALFLPGWVQAELLSSILPGKRTVQVGTTATAFATILTHILKTIAQPV